MQPPETLRHVSELLQQPSLRGVRLHKSLHTLTRENLSRIDRALGVDSNHVEPEELAAVLTHLTHVTHNLTRLPVQEPDLVVREI